MLISVQSQTNLRRGPLQPALRGPVRDTMTGWVEYPRDDQGNYVQNYADDSNMRSWTERMESTASSARNPERLWAERNEKPVQPDAMTGASASQPMSWSPPAAPGGDGGSTYQRSSGSTGAGADENAGAGYGPREWAAMAGDDQAEMSSSERRKKIKADNLERR